MRIAVTNNFFPPRVGGSSHLSDSLAREYVKAGHEVLVITGAHGDAPAEEHRDGFRIIRLPVRHLPQLGTEIDFDITFASGIRNFRRLFSLLDGFRPDVIHLNGQFLDLTWMTAVYARRRKVPCLIGVHTRLESPSPRLAAAFRVLDAVAVLPWLRLARPRYVVMDRPMYDYIRSRYRPRDDELVPIPVGIYVADIDPDRDGSAVRAELGIGDRPMIMALGHVIQLRNHVELVRGLAVLVGRGTDAVLVAVGNVHYPRFLELAEELGIADHVISTGAQPRDRIGDFLAAADLEVHELEGHGLGTATLEAMAAEIPIVAAVRPDNFIDFALVDGENLTIVPLHDPEALATAIQRLLDDPEAARRVARAQRELVVEHFAMDRVAQRYLEELADLAKRASASTATPDE